MFFIEHKGISKRKFYSLAGISRGTLESETGITEDIMAKCIAAFPEINLIWLITGKGEIVRGSANQESLSLVNEDKPADCKYCREKDKVIEAQGKTITAQQKYILLLEIQIEQKRPGETGQKRKAG